VRTICLAQGNGSEEANDRGRNMPLRLLVLLRRCVMLQQLEVEQAPLVP
jgi:hypothetical protein